MTIKVALVTGASSGIGEATVQRLKALGFTVYAAARRIERMQHLADSGVHVLAMDVTNDDALQAGIADIIARSGRIDVLVNNAGYGSYGAVEDVSLDEVRAQHSGTIVNITSMGGKLHTPLGAWYHGTKFALEAISDCLRMEVQPVGIDVVVIEPGGIRTEWGGIAADKLREVSGNGAYAGQAQQMAESLAGEAGRKRLSPPELIANTIARAVAARHPKTRYVSGFGARPLIFLRRWLPDRAFDRLLRLATGVSR